VDQAETLSPGLRFVEAPAELFGKVVIKRMDPGDHRIESRCGIQYAMQLHKPSFYPQVYPPRFPAKDGFPRHRKGRNSHAKSDTSDESRTIAAGRVGTCACGPTSLVNPWSMRAGRPGRDRDIHHD